MSSNPDFEAAEAAPSTIVKEIQPVTGRKDLPDPAIFEAARLKANLQYGNIIPDVEADEAPAEKPKAAAKS